jgi:NitT/TauT family transport system substrate-binding protein
MGDIVRISATGSGIPYYPEFVARALGFYEDLGLDVVVDVFGNGPVVPRNIASGAGDIGLGGIWLPMLYRGRVADFFPFAQLCDRYSGVVLARQPMASFSWSDLAGKIVLSTAGAPNTYTILHGILRREGVDASSMRLVADFVNEEATNLFRGGFGDFYVLQPPASTLLIDEGVAFPVKEVSEIGQIPWSIFYAKRPFLEREDNVAGRFCLAIQRALDWVHTHDPEEAPAVWERYFPFMTPGQFVSAARASRAQGIWAQSIEISRPGYAAWHDMILESRLIERPQAYDELIDRRPMDWALAQHQPATAPTSVARS